MNTGNPPSVPRVGTPLGPPELSIWGVRGLSALRLAQFVTSLYVFLLSVTLIGEGFKLFGKPFAEVLVSSTSNPFIGLFVGVLATSLVQSSSATTSMVVCMVAAGTLSVRNAVPIVMGANIGTTVTNTLVSLGHITRKDEFRRAFPAAVVHDFFNLLVVAILLPVELATRYLERTAGFLSAQLWGTGGVEFKSPLKAVLKPAYKAIINLLKGVLPKTGAGALAVVLGVALLFGSLWLISKLMRRAMTGRIEGVLDKTIGRAPILGFVFGMAVTAVVQSSSATTSVLVPLAAAGILTVEQVFPITLGANIGTTITALLAALAVGPAGLTIALAHLLFNITGILLIYPFGPVRRIPITLARRMGDIAADSKRYAFAYVVGTFFVVPGLLVFAWRLF